MLFARGQWALVGVEKASLEKFRLNLIDTNFMFEVSQLVASVRTRFRSTPAFGINPFAAPRIDEVIPPVVLQDINSYLDSVTDSSLIDALVHTHARAFPPMPCHICKVTHGEERCPNRALDWVAGFSCKEADFKLHPEQNVYGLWAVFNEYEDVNDAASKREEASYVKFNTPYKLLNTEDKKVVDQTVQAQTVVMRKQYPVLLDFDEGRVYIANGNKETVSAIREMLDELGAVTYSICWDFGHPDWPGKLLSKIYQESRFVSQFQKRAEERQRFSDKEIEKLEDKMMEKIVSNFFSMTEMENALWAGITTPARIRVYSASDPATVAEPTTATSLLQFTDQGQIVSAGVVFQELTTRFNKQGVERQLRNDLFTVDINDNVQLLDAGAAMLRGFDLPGYKKIIKAAVLGVPEADAIARYWYEWLRMMRGAVYTFIDSVYTVLNQPGERSKVGLVRFASEVKEETVTVEG